jgi:hypothetical protein
MRERARKKKKKKIKKKIYLKKTLLNGLKIFKAKKNKKIKFV